MKAPSPSAEAMSRFIAGSPGLQEPRIWESIPGLPSLPDLKALAQTRRAQGLPTVDQSAGDISDVGEPMSDEFLAFVETIRDKLVAEGNKDFARYRGNPSGFPGNYKMQFPPALEAAIDNWGIQGPTKSVHTVSGRKIIEETFLGLKALAKERGIPEPHAIIVDPTAWSGLMPLAKRTGITLVSSPAKPETGLASSTEGLKEAVAYAEGKGLNVIGFYPILPSNPSGGGMSVEELADSVRFGARRPENKKFPTIVDAFYAPISTRGHQKAAPIGQLEKMLEPEDAGELGFIYGDTKVIESQDKTGALVMLAPEGHDQTARVVVGSALKGIQDTNAYPSRSAALASTALHRFPGGIHAAMGPRYDVLNASRGALQALADELGLALSIGGSFYGMMGLRAPDGSALIRDTEGKPVTDPIQVAKILAEQHGLVGAAGAMFSSAPEAGSLIRLTTAVSVETIQRDLRGILEKLLDQAKIHG